MRPLLQLLSALVALIIGQVTYAQLSVTNSAPNNSPGHLVQNVFMGANITAMNFKWNGSTAATVSTNQMAYFSGGGNIFGIDSGIVLSSGNSLTAGQNIFKSASYNGAGDADVLAVAQSVGWGTPPSIMRDRSVLEFDFVAPASDSIAFEYVFGSEEWPSYPCSQYNDAFGFFISGPGISGPYSNSSKNVSVVPGTASLPVAITSIHNGTGASPCNGNPSYAQYYNTGPTSQPFCYAGSNANQYSGAFTDLFMTKPIFVNACDTYHVKMAICDGVDWIFDSDVYLKAHSFSFLSMNVTPQPTYNPWGFDTALYEGCGDLDLFFSRIDSTYAPYTLVYGIYGTATMGQDYSNVPGCTYTSTIGNVNYYNCEVIFQQDSANVSLDIEIYFDNFNESFESFNFVVLDSNVSMCHGTDTLYLNIVDQPDLVIQPFGATTLDCNDDPAVIGVQVTNGLPPFTFSWSNTTSTDSTQTVAPPQTTVYVVQVEDGCGYQTEATSITVGVFNVPWSSVKIGDNQTMSCVDPPVDLAVAVQFNDGLWHGDITYLWSTGSTDSTISVSTLVQANYSVTITRGCTGETQVHTFTVNVYNDPVVLTTVDIEEGVIDCPGTPVTINVTAAGGYAPYSYQWSDGAPNDWTVVAPLVTTTYYVTVYDDCALVPYVDSVIVNVPVAKPLEIFGVINDTVPCPQQKVHFGKAVPSGGFGFGYQFSWDNFATIADYTQAVIMEDTPFTIKLIDGCLADTGELTVWGIIAAKNDLEVALPNDTLICLGESIQLKAMAAHGGGEYVYFWQDATVPGAESITISPKTPTTYMVRVQDACDTVREASVTIDVSEVRSDFEYAYISDYEASFTNKSWSTHEIKATLWTVDGTSLVSDQFEPVIPLPDGNAYDVNLEVINEHGCKDIASMLIKPEYHLYIPTGFSPNNDGSNDVWSIGSLGIREMKLEVYSRWGDVLFSTNDKSFTWDGTYQGQRLPMGAYAWRLVLYTDLDEYVERRGTVILLNDLAK